ncbi:MAG: hypothetical protein ABSB71_09590 [Candidatus Bathyarchaeia archaeon]
MLDLNSLINSMINGVFVGMGSGVGIWIVTRHFLRHLEALEEKLKNGNGKAGEK